MACTPYVDTSSGRITVHTTAGRPTGAARYVGKMIFNSSTSAFEWWDGTGWIVISQAPQAWTPSYTGVTTTTGTHSAYYYRSNGFCHFRATFTLGASSAVTGAIILTVPIAAAATEDLHGHGVMFVDATVNNYPGVTIGTATTTLRLDALNAAGTYALQTASGSAVPLAAYGTGDGWTVTGSYRMTTLYS